MSELEVSTGDVVFSGKMDGAFNFHAQKMRDAGKEYAPEGTLYQEIELRRATFLQKYISKIGAEQYEGIRLFEIWARYIRRRIGFVFAEGQMDTDIKIPVLAVDKLDAALGANEKKKLGIGWIGTPVADLTSVRIFLHEKEPVSGETLWQLYKRFDPKGKHRMHLREFYRVLPASWKNAYHCINATCNNCKAIEKWLKDNTPIYGESISELYMRIYPKGEKSIDLKSFSLLLPDRWLVNVDIKEIEAKAASNKAHSAAQLTKECSMMHRLPGKIIQGRPIEIPSDANPLSVLLALLQEPFINSTAIIQIYESHQSAISASLRKGGGKLLENFSYVIQVAQRIRNEAVSMEDQNVAMLIKGLLALKIRPASLVNTSTRLQTELPADSLPIESETSTGEQSIPDRSEYDALATERHALQEKLAAVQKEREAESHSNVELIAGLREEIQRLANMLRTFEGASDMTSIGLKKREEILDDRERDLHARSVTLNKRYEELQKQIEELEVQRREIESMRENERQPQLKVSDTNPAELPNKNKTHSIPDFPGLDTLLKALGRLSIRPSNPETRAEYARGISEALGVLDIMTREVQRRASQTEAKTGLFSLTPAERRALGQGKMHTAESRKTEINPDKTKERQVNDYIDRLFVKIGISMDEKEIIAWKEQIKPLVIPHVSKLNVSASLMFEARRLAMNLSGNKDEE